MKKKLLIIMSTIVVLLLIIASIFGINIYKKNKEFKQRQDAISSLKNQFNEFFEAHNEIQIYNILQKAHDQYPEEFDSFASTFKSNISKIIENRERESANFLNQLNDIMSESENENIHKLSKNLSQLIDDNFENMLLSQLKGRWKREDSSALSGTVIEINVNGENPAAIIYDISNAVNNQNYFKVGDIKWNYISCVDKSVFTFTDMWKTGEYNINYLQARGIYNYATDTIDISVGTSVYDGITEYNGLSQHWVRDNQTINENGNVDLTAEESYEEEQSYIVQQTYNPYKKSGILDSLGMTEEEFRNSCYDLGYNNTDEIKLSFNDLLEYPNNYKGRHFTYTTDGVWKGVRVSYKGTTQNGDIYYIQDKVLTQQIFFDVRDDVYSPTISQSDHFIPYMIFTGIQTLNGIDYLCFNVISIDKI